MQKNPTSPSALTQSHTSPKQSVYTWLETRGTLILCGRELPYVKQADHLGNILTEQGDMEQDAAVKRAKFIQSSVEIREVFKFAAPTEVLKALKIHSSSFYGSCLWDLGGEKAKQVLGTPP